MNRSTPRPRPTGTRCWPFVAVFLFLLPSVAPAVTWVDSPAPVSTAGGQVVAGGRCGAFVDIDGDHLLFFESYDGTWTEVELGETHDLLDLQAAGDVVLVVMDDLLIAFDAPDKTVHQMPLAGSLLATLSNPSWSCSGELAAAITDQILYVFDARRDGWVVYGYSMPDYQSHRVTHADADYVAVELYGSSSGPVNLAYSLHTGTVELADPGVANLAQGHLLDHGFAGQFGPWDDVHGLGYSAITGSFSEVEPDPPAIGYGGEQVDRRRRELCHLWSLSGTTGDLYTQWLYLHVYDTLTGTWTSQVHSWDKVVSTGGGTPFMGGSFLSFYSKYQDTQAYEIYTFWGHDHGMTQTLPGFAASGLGRRLGGEAGAYATGYDLTGSTRWFAHSVAHPYGMLVSPSRPVQGPSIAGQDYVFFCARETGDPRMDVYFYHGPSNRIRTVEMWSTTGSLDHDGTYVHALATNGDDIDIVLYSGIHHQLFVRHLPAGSWPATFVGEDLALVYRNGTGDYLLDGRRGTLKSRGCDFASGSLGDDVCLGLDPVAEELHAYSSLSGHWTTHPTDGLNYVEAGGTVGLGFRSDYQRFYGFAGDEDAWAPLDTGGMSFVKDVGDHTILVADTDRVWALWQDQATAAPDQDPPSASISGALARMRCYPNPFNGRVNVSFDLPRRAVVRIEVFDPRGRKVTTLIDELRNVGRVDAVWSTGDAASGVYLVRAVADGHVAVRKVSLVQ